MDSNSSDRADFSLVMGGAAPTPPTARLLRLPPSALSAPPLLSLPLLLLQLLLLRCCPCPAKERLGAAAEVRLSAPLLLKTCCTSLKAAPDKQRADFPDMAGSSKAGGKKASRSRG